jgi:hypothetical protein
MCEVNIGSILYARFSDFRDFILRFIDLLAKIQGIVEHFPTSGKRLYDFWPRAGMRELHNGFPLLEP